MIEPAAVSVPWADVIKLVLGTGLVATLATQLVAWIIDRAKSERSAQQDARYLSARVAVTLEHFAIRCAEQIANNQLHRDTRGYAGSASYKLPQLDDFPAEANWALLDPELLSRSLSIRNEALLGQQAITAVADIDPDPLLVAGACDAQAGLGGYRALRLAADLRSRYRLPSFTPSDFSWDLTRVLKEHHDRELARIRDAMEE